MTQHTLGPWETRDGFVRTGPPNHPDTKPICYVQGSARKPNVAETLANARLIAAAPDLLAVAQSIIDLNIEYENPRLFVQGKALAAIAKATQ